MVRMFNPDSLLKPLSDIRLESINFLSVIICVTLLLLIPYVVYCIIMMHLKQGTNMDYDKSLKTLLDWVDTQKEANDLIQESVRVALEHHLNNRRES